jgi:hypothetical protein
MRGLRRHGPHLGSGHWCGTPDPHRRQCVGRGDRPDGTWLAATGGDGTVRIWDPVTRIRRRIFTCVGTAAHFEWSGETSVQLERSGSKSSGSVSGECRSSPSMPQTSSVG